MILLHLPFQAQDTVYFFKEEKKNDDTRVPGSFYSNKNYLKCTIQKQGNQ